MTAVSLGWRRTLVLLGIFVLSGASSLVYQILWVRVLSLTVGSTVYAISLVISAFMAGLALGSAWFGRRVDGTGHPLRLYAFLELGIGLAAVLLPFALQGIARSAVVQDGPFAGLLAASVFPFVASFVLLLVPTTLMGGTLPVLSRYVAGFDTSRGASIGLLYSLNTAGAIVGTAVTGFFLIRVLGIYQATLCAAAVNGVVFALSLVLSRRWPAPAPAATDPRRPRPEPGARRKDGERAGPRSGDERRLLGAVTLVYAINGMAGLALEVLWTRAILLFTINSIYAFTVILTTFLVGLAGGSSLMSAWVGRIRRPGVWLGGLQCALAVISAATPFALNEFGLSLFGWGGEVFEPLRHWGRVLSVYVVAAAFMLPATLVMGASFPLVARLVAGSTDQVGGAVGRVYALNTLGAVAGSLLAGFVALPAIGIQRSILLFAAVAGGSGLFLLVRAGARPLAGAGAVATAGIVVLLFVSPNHFRTMLSRYLDQELTYYEEGVETTVGVYDSQKAKRPVLVINNTALADRGVVHKLLVHLPMLLHPDPTRALVLGFGVGISNQSLSAYGIPVNDCVEISPAVMNAAPYFASVNGDIAGRGDPAFRVFLQDGRRLLLREQDPYDLIVLDANTGSLSNAGVGKLYTRDFFELCRRRLAEDGMVTLFVSPNGSLRQFKMVARTFNEVFPHSSLWVDRVFGQTCVLMGTNSPFTIDLARMHRRMESAEVRADLEPFDLDDVGALLGCFLMGPEILRMFSADGEMNTDDRPLMEFYPLGMSTFEANDRPISDIGFLLHRESVRPYLKIPDAPWVTSLFEYLDAEERSFPALCEAWVFLSYNNTQLYRRSMGIAHAIHPQSEHVRSHLGFGRRARASAIAEATVAGTSEVYGRLGDLLLRRGEWRESANAFGEAIARASEEALPDSTVLAGYHVGQAQCFREMGRPDAARPGLEIAASLRGDVGLERVLVDLALTSNEPGDRIPALRAVVKVAFQRRDYRRAADAILELQELGDPDPQLALLLARSLEALGDPAGAWIQYRSLLDRVPDHPVAQTGLRRIGIELALRQDVFRRAHAGDAGRGQPLRSANLDASAPAGQVGVIDHRTPEPWLELSSLYLARNRAFEAYRKARAARTVAPDAIGPYQAIARSAEALGQQELVDTANKRVRALGGSVSLAD